MSQYPLLFWTVYLQNNLSIYIYVIGASLMLLRTYKKNNSLSDIVPYFYEKYPDLRNNHCICCFCSFVLILYVILVNIFSLMSGRVFLG